MKNQPILFLFIGYPGAGKTTIAKMIADTTEAVHIWADVERHKLFNKPTHSNIESHKLYEKLNSDVDKLLKSGKSVIFDTNFNHFKDRELLRNIAAKHNALTLIIWVNTPKKLAKYRSVTAKVSRNLYEMSMSDKQFEDIAGKLEFPKDSEKVIEIDGTDTTKAEVLKKLKEVL